MGRLLSSAPVAPRTIGLVGEEGLRSCGSRQHGITSLHAEGVAATMTEVDSVMKATFP